jgi:hypothetical protein
MRTSSIFTAEQHRWMATNLLAKAGTPGHPSKERAAQMARNHEIMAKMIEHRQTGHTTTPYSDAPSIIPAISTVAQF